MPVAAGTRGVGYHTVMPYITVRNTEAFVRFAKEVFDAEEMFRVTHPDGSIHCEMRIGDAVVMCGGGGSRFTGPEMLTLLHIYVPDTDAAYRRALEAGAESLSPPEDKPYGERNAGVKDPAGNQWYMAARLGGESQPEGFRAVIPYVVRPGATGLMDFLTRAFNGRQEGIMKGPDGKVMHALVFIGDSVVEIGDADRPASAFILNVPNVDEVYRQALDAGATSLFAPENFHWGVRMGGVKDAWENTWTISTELNK